MDTSNIEGRDIVFTDNKHGWLFCNYGKIYRTENGDKVTSVEDYNTQIPSKFNLEQNYPNPFNPNTTIGYELRALSVVMLKVYDILGREVATLVNEPKSAGRHTAEWNAVNLPSGVYIYEINAGKFSDVKKMILLR